MVSDKLGAIQSDDDPSMEAALLEGASGVFERGGRKRLEVDEEQVKELHAKIGELAVANSFLERKLKPGAGSEAWYDRA